MRRVDGKLNGSDWKMGSHVKKKDTSSCDEKEQIVIPLKQMIQEDEEDEENFIGETVTRLTGNVRACYLNHLEKILVNNYEVCCEKDLSEWPFSRDDVIKCAAWMEQKALRSCMVVILYQRAITRLAADIKKHTEQLKLYRKLKDYVTSDSVRSDKTTERGEHFAYIDKTTQTDPEAIVPDIEISTGTQEDALESHNLQIQTKTEVSLTDTINQCFQPLAIKPEPPTSEAIHKEPVEGIPIPVYVSAVRSAGQFPVVNGIEPMPYYEMNQESMPNVITDNLFKCPIISSEAYPGGSTEKFTSQQNINEEPYEWSVIENQTRLNTKKNAPSTKSLVCVRRLSNLQQNETLFNGPLCSDKLSDLDLEECPRMSIDDRLSSVFSSEGLEGCQHMSIEDRLSSVLSSEGLEECQQMSIDDRISSVLKREVNHLSNGEELRDKIVIEDDKERSPWTVEKRHQQELLRAKILETCVDVRKRGRMRLRFLELFGSDSEDSFDVEEHGTNFKDRIARWVVESLMPYYREGRIKSRPLFKFLARHIADTLLLENLMPDEADVEQSVIDFFNRHDVIQSEDDICL